MNDENETTLFATASVQQRCGRQTQNTCSVMDNGCMIMDTNKPYREQDTAVTVSVVIAIYLFTIKCKSVLQTNNVCIVHMSDL